MLNRYKLFLVVLVLTVVVASSPLAIASTAKNISLGDDFVTLIGPNAFYSNPAGVNVGPERFTLELGAGAGFWNNLLHNEYIEEEEKDDLLARIDEGLLLGLDAIGGTKLIIGPVGLSLDIKGDALVDLAPDIGELLLKGNEIDREYSFDGSRGYGGLYGDAALNLSLRAPQDLIEEWGLEDLYVGVTYHRLMGMIFNFEGDGSINLDYGQNGEEPSFKGGGVFKVKSSTMDDLATGSALDLGAYAKLNDKYSIGFSVLNIGSLKADRIEYMEYELQADEDGNVEDFEEIHSEERDEKIEWRLPSTFRMGAKVNGKEWLTLFGDYAYTDYSYGKKDHTFSTGAEITTLSFLPLRTGLSYSTLESRVKWAAGFGLCLGSTKVDLGVSDLKGIFNKAKVAEVALNLRIQF